MASEATASSGLLDGRGASGGQSLRVNPYATAASLSTFTLGQVGGGAQAPPDVGSPPTPSGAQAPLGRRKRNGGATSHAKGQDIS